MSEERYLTTADALVYLRTTPRTLYRHLAAGEIPGVRMGHQWRFRKNDLDRWIERQSGRGPAGEKTATPPPPPRIRRVLVVDDEPAVCKTIVTVLGTAECDVEGVRNGWTAVERLRTRAYDLVITDLRMPGMDGIAVAREAKRLQPGIRVVIVTGHPSRSSAIEAVNIGVDGYLTKPFDPADVLMAAARTFDLGSTQGHAG